MRRLFRPTCQTGYRAKLVAPAGVRRPTSWRLILGLSLLILGSSSVIAKAAEVWLVPIQPEYRRDGRVVGPGTIPAMFRADAPWAHAASRLQVIKLSTQFVLWSPEDILAGVLADSRRRGLALAIEGLMLTTDGTPDACGLGIEGYTGPDDMRMAAERIRRLGGDLRYVAMDEPLWFGHAYRGPRACQTPLPDLARAVARTVAAIKQVFPRVRVGGVEPLGDPVDAGWSNLMTAWASAFQAEVGEPLAFVHFDVQWQRDWEGPARDLSTRLREAGIPVGFIYNGDPTDLPVPWVARADARVLHVETRLNIPVDHAIFQVWGNPHPPHNMPDDDPGSITHLIARYAAPKSTLTLDRMGPRLVGRLTTGDGSGISGARVRLFASDSGSGNVTEVQRISGLVPPNATLGIVGLRVNTECACGASADLTVGSLRYHEEPSRTLHERMLPASPLMGTEGRIVVSETERVLLNAPPFPVVAGNRFTLDVPLRASPVSERAGYITLIFQGPTGQGIMRYRLSLLPGKILINEVTTDRDGRFATPIAAAALGPGLHYHAAFDGNETVRRSEAEVR